jgi:uncharacterized repeat protein (TIGR01451 family)
MQNDGTRYLLWAVTLCVIFFFLELSYGQSSREGGDLRGGVSPANDPVKYQEMKAAGLLSTPRHVGVNFPKQLRPENIIHPLVKATGAALLIPRDETFSVVQFAGGTPPDFRNDDGSTVAIPLSFLFTFYGNQFNQVFINNNGNVSFEGPYSTFTPQGFPIADFGMVAPFWGDVDTRNLSSGLVYFKSEAHRLTIIWEGVGYYNQKADKINTFEVIITDGSDELVGIGNNICFSYDNMQWTTGDASGGVNGFGGSPATVGANRGDGVNFALIGRFDHEGIDYDGAGGGNDGVSYLDGKAFCFNVAQGAGTIAGTKFRDDNGDGIRQEGEPGIQGWTIRLDPGPTFTTTDIDGDYFFSFLPPNTYTVSEVQRPNWDQTFPDNPGTHVLVVDAGQTFVDRNFGNQPIANVQDLAVSVAGGVARPGFQKYYGIFYENRGTLDVNSTVIFDLPEQLTFVDAALEGVYDGVSHSVTWNLGLLTAGFRGWLWVVAQVPPSTPLGTFLTSSVEINPLAGDINTFNNFDSETQVVRGSFDPNDKLVTPEGVGPDNLISRDDVLTYQIRFQNTGTDTAFTVVVRDALDADLDLSTVEVGASSHPFSFTIVEPRELVWTFNNIQLPDSNVNEPASHGFLKFTVKPNSSVQTGMVISNTASIFFDFNEPVVTNTVVNEIGSTGGDIAVSPNPFNYGEVELGEFLEHTFVVSNADLFFADLVVSSTSIIGTNSDQFSIISGGGSFTLAPGASRNIVVRFSPSSIAGVKTAALRLTSNDENESIVDVSLSGTAVSTGDPDISAVPNPHHFGSVVVGSNTTQIFQVTNDFKAVENLVVNSADIIGSNAGEFSITSGGAPFTIAPNQSHNVTVRFQPSSVGSKSATLRFFSNDPDESPYNVNLTGTGTGTADIQASHNSFNFGSVSVQSTIQQIFVISNSNLASENLVVSSTGISGSNFTQFSIVSGGGSFSLAPGQTREILVSFTPSSIGFKEATLQIFSNDVDENPFNIFLSGNGIGTPVITVSLVSYNFGQVVIGDNASNTFTIGNAITATAALTVSSTTISGTNADQFSIISGGGDFSLEPGQNRNITINFHPSSLPAKSAVLNIFSNDPDNATTQIQLFGKGNIHLETSVLQNPASSKYADIVVVSDVFLVNPPLVTAGLSSSPASVLMSLISGADKAYKGAFEFTAEGTYTINTRVSQSNADTTSTRTFGVTLAKAGLDKDIATLDGQATLHVGSSAIYGETYFVSETRQEAEEAVYHFGPALTFDQPQKLEIRYDETSIIDPGKLFIYQKQNGQWIRLESQVFTSNRKVRALVGAPGEFKIGYDASFTGSNIVPAAYALQQNYPNPFNPGTTILYDLPEDGRATLVVYNMLGQAVKTLQDGFQLAGTHRIVWDARDDRGSQVASGVYFYTLKVGEFTQTKKMLLLR